jgi:hypothetical protein
MILNRDVLSVRVRVRVRVRVMDYGGNFVIML